MKAKKLFALLLTAAMLMSLTIFAQTASAAAPTMFSGTTIYDETFESYDEGEVSTTTTAVVAAISGAQIAKETDGNKYLYLPASGGRYTVNFKNNASLTKDFVFEFDIKLGASATQGNAGQGFLALSNNSGEPEFRLYDDAARGMVRAPGGNYKALMPYEKPGDWQSFKIIVSMTKGIIEWYSAPRGEELVLRDTSPIANVSATRLNLYHNKDISYDNFKIYEYVTADSVNAMIQSAEQEIAIAKADKPIIQYSPDEISAYEAAVATAKALVADAYSASDIEVAESGLRYAKQVFQNQGTPMLPRKTILSETLQDGTLDNTYTAQSGMSVVDDPAEKKGKVIQFTGSARGILAANLTGNKYILTTSFMQTEKSDIYHIMAMIAKGSDNGYNAQNYLFKIYSNGTDLRICYADNAAGTASWGNKEGVLVSNYAANTWYDLKVMVDYETRTLAVYVNDNPVLTDTVLYFGGNDTSNKSDLRAVYPYANTAGTVMYLSDIALYEDKSASLMDAFNTLSDSFNAVTGTETEIALPATVSGYDVAWYSQDYQIADGKAYPYFASDKEAGVLSAVITVDGQDFSYNYTLPMAKTYTGTVVDHDYDNWTAGTSVRDYDTGYRNGTANNVVALDASVGTGNAVKMDVRMLYDVPADKQAADILVAEADFYFNDNQNAGVIFWVSDQAGQGTQVEKQNEKLRVVHNGIYYFACAYETGKWYPIRVVQNFKTRTYRVYIDGELVCEDRNFVIPVTYRKADRLSFVAGNYYMDNLKVYNGVSVNEVVLPESATVKVDRYKDNTLKLNAISKAADGMGLADDYVYTLSGDDTTGITLENDVLTVSPEATATSVTVTAISKTDNSKTDSMEVVLAGTFSWKASLEDNVVTISATNETVAPKNAVFLAAVYENGVLKAVDKADVTNLEGTDTLTIRNLGDTAGLQVKLFAWEALNSAAPIAEAQELQAYQPAPEEGEDEDEGMTPD